MAFYLNGLRYRPRQAKRTSAGILSGLLLLSILGNLVQWTSQKAIRTQLNNAIVSNDSTLAAKHETEKRLVRLEEELNQQKTLRLISDKR